MDIQKKIHKISLSKNQQIRLTIDALSSDGNGLGRYDGQVVFVPNTAPGDEAEVKIVRLQKTHAFGKLLALHKESPHRIKPDCRVACVCGGCSFRHIHYGEELLAKEQFVHDAIRRIGKIEAPFLPILPSPKTEAYRNKVQYPLAQDESGSLQYGFYANRSHRLVSCETCRLQPPLLNEITAAAVQQMQMAGIDSYNETTHSGLLRHICLRQSNKTKKVLLTFVVNGDAFPTENKVVDNLTRRFPEISGIYLNIHKKPGNVIFGSRFRLLYGEETLDDELCGVPQRLSPDSFSQVNSAAAERLFQTAREFACITPGDRVLDMYCGTGVIGLSMAKDCTELVGIEIVQKAVDSARQSAFAMEISHARFLCMDAAKAAEKLLNEGFRPDVALLDPPRKGCGLEALKPLLQMAPKKIVMISCNPATLARDLAILTDKGYKTEKIQAVDMFPRTRHVECVVFLSRIEKPESP